MAVVVQHWEQVFPPHHAILGERSKLVPAHPVSMQILLAVQYGFVFTYKILLVYNSFEILSYFVLLD